MTTGQLKEIEMSAYSQLAIQAEERRERAKRDSAEYWKQHEIALFWHHKLEQFQPTSGRTIKDSDFRD